MGPLKSSNLREERFVKTLPGALVPGGRGLRVSHIAFPRGRSASVFIDRLCMRTLLHFHPPPTLFVRYQCWAQLT